MTVLVSVVVATFNSPPGLDDLLASLDAQTLPAGDFELVFVDDGSTDDTFERLGRLAAERPHMRVERIANSGWPGRPRNVGTALARGDYVFYADHDDYLFPEALERMHRFAVENELDVVHPKEVVKGWGRPGWVAFREHLPRVDRLDQVVLQCITPHKLYRRSFLLEHEVRFPEGRVRLEDFSINGLAWAHTDAIGVLADYPCYQWIIHQDNSHKASYDYDVYWASFVSSLGPVLAMPAGDKRDQLLVRWYRSRVLERVAGTDQHDPAYREQLLDTFAGLLAHFPPHLDALLGPADRARSALLRADDREGMVTLAELDRALHLEVTAGGPTWHEGRLLVAVEASIVDDQGAPVALRRAGDRWLRVAPPDLGADLPDEVWDLTAAVEAAFGEVVVRSRETAVDWILPTRSDVVADQTGIRMRLTTEIDLLGAAGGRALGAEAYDVFVRMNGLGYTPTCRVPAPQGLQSAALVHGLPAVALATHADWLAVDLSGQLRNLVGVAGLLPGSLHDGPDGPDGTDGTAGTAGSSVQLDRVHVWGRTELPVHLETRGRSQDAALVADDGRARLESPQRLVAGGTLHATVQGRRSRPLQVPGAAGPVPTRGPGDRARSALHDLRGRVGRALRG